MSITAVRTWNKPRTKATVTVTFADGSTDQLGGNRAGRASAVIVVQFSMDSQLGVLGLRADVHAAETEAARYLRPGRYGSAPAIQSGVVLVTEEAS